MSPTMVQVMRRVHKTTERGARPLASTTCSSGKASEPRHSSNKASGLHQSLRSDGYKAQDSEFLQAAGVRSSRHQRLRQLQGNMRSEFFDKGCFRKTTSMVFAKAPH